MTSIPSFQQYVAIDWSGAKGNSHKGIAIAACEIGTDCPRLISPPSGRFWSRYQVAKWLIETSKHGPTLFGFDFSFAPPFIQRQSYLPGDMTADKAQQFWAYVDQHCADVDLGAASFLEEKHRRHFYFGKADGKKSEFLHHRQCEIRYLRNGGRKPSTIYDAIGAAQVAKASFAGMRLLHHIKSDIPIWPFDPLPKLGSLIVEIYTSIAAKDAGQISNRSKFRDVSALNIALSVVHSDPYQGRYIDDHSTDALITSAWLRHCANDPTLWYPATLDNQTASTEGWTFGVR